LNYDYLYLILESKNIYILVVFQNAFPVLSNLLLFLIFQTADNNL